MQTTLSPVQVTTARLLSLPCLELSQAVQEELDTNPALELTEGQEHCPICGHQVTGVFCLACAGIDPGAGESRDPSPSPDNFMTVAAPVTAADMLLRDVCQVLPAGDHPIAATLIASLDEHGFLDVDHASIATQLNVTETRVASVLEHIQSAGSAGIGLRGAREWLLSQIDERASMGSVWERARLVVDGYLEALAAHRDQEIASGLELTVQEVHAIRALIRDQLLPFPVASLREATGRPENTVIHWPDLAVREQGASFAVEVLNSSRRWIRVDPAYLALTQSLATLAPHERDQVHAYLDRARTFLRGLKNRDRTLKKIGDAVVSRQDPFLRGECRFHAHVTQREIALDVGVDGSTVSRAVTNKLVELPARRIVPFVSLLSSAADIRAALRNLIQEEQTPLTDDELAQRLTEQGLQVARRTIAKYRNEMGIAPYSERGPTRA
jgi:RNA polymerase sigma-54 factor